MKGLNTTRCSLRHGVESKLRTQHSPKKHVSQLVVAAVLLNNHEPKITKADYLILRGWVPKNDAVSIFRELRAIADIVGDEHAPSRPRMMAMSRSPTAPRTTDRRCTRRQLLEVGGIGLLGLSLPELLWAGAPARAKGPEKSCIFIVQYGGASHIDTLDPKPNAAQEIRGPYKPIATTVP